MESVSDSVLKMLGINFCHCFCGPRAMDSDMSVISHKGSGVGHSSASFTAAGPP